MENKETLVQQVRELLQSQQLAVLATHHKGQPYASLVAFAAGDDLREIYFATSRTTRKYANLSSDPRVALLVDSRSNEVSDFHRAAAATIVGEAQEVDEREREEVTQRYLLKHPHLEDFVRSPTCAILRVRAQTYYLVSKFQKVMELHIHP
jgi:nitroimidazol reductase NimA-like FMN-containing flavoprotein (pyridoxamine 5'-phosphate oxidase superfamily)